MKKLGIKLAKKEHRVASHLVISSGGQFVDSIISEPKILMQQNLLLDSFWMDWIGVPSSHFVGWNKGATRKLKISTHPAVT